MSCRLRWHPVGQQLRRSPLGRNRANGSEGTDRRKLLSRTLRTRPLWQGCAVQCRARGCPPVGVAHCLARLRVGGCGQDREAQEAQHAAEQTEARTQEEQERLEAARAEAMALATSRVGDEPTDAAAFAIVVKLPNGSRITRKFISDDTVQVRVRVCARADLCAWCVWICELAWRSVAAAMLTLGTLACSCYLIGSILRSTQVTRATSCGLASHLSGCGCWKRIT